MACEPRPDPAVPMVEVAGATLTLGGIRILDRVDLALAPREILALLGPNGAGKSSLMRLVAGRLVPDSGTVRVGGADPFRRGAARRTIGWVPQEIALYPRLTVAENLSVFADLIGLPRRARAASVTRALDRTGTGEVAGRPVGQLSGGYQRRVNIAASLLGEPRLILLDEPTQGVDLAARTAIHALLGRLRSEGAGILIATHDFAEAERLADRVAFVGSGRIVREGPLPAMLARIRSSPPLHEVALTEVPDRAAEAALRRAGFVPAEAGIADAAPALVWRAAMRVGHSLDGAALLGRLRGQGVPAGEVRVRAPGLEALYREALEPAAPVQAPSLPCIARAAR
ncbi:ABC transporter ATP-binding protein [Methylobacterium durans]|nr:ABC transporter ATP-binding protein [Methylobacterium durans]